MTWRAARIVARGTDADGLIWRADWRMAVDVDTEPIALTALCGLLETSGDARPRSAGFGLAGQRRFREAAPLPRAEDVS